MMKKNGFTLVEVLVTVLIIGIIGYILSDILINSLNNGRKSEVIGNVKQNAQNTLSKMSEVLRNADVITCNNSGILGVLNKDGTYTRFRFYPPPSITTNGYVTQDFPGSTTSIPPAQSINLCDPTSSPPFPPVSEITLSDRDPIKGVSIVNGLFVITPAPGAKESVTISFDVNNGAQSGGGYQNRLLNLAHFETIVQLR